jgi:hypothetical protein
MAQKVEKQVAKIEKRSMAKRARPKPGEVAPNFNSLFGGPPSGLIENPLNRLPQQDNPEEAAQQEVSVALQTILDEKNERRDAYRTMLDTEFWCAICFQSRAQKEQFLAGLGVLDLGDKYIDGLLVAERLGVPIEVVNLSAKEVRKAPKLLRKVVI